jgi:hypothetical protein
MNKIFSSAACVVDAGFKYVFAEQKTLAFSLLSNASSFNYALFLGRQSGYQVIFVHTRDVCNRNFLWTNSFTRSGKRTAAKTFSIHLRNHAENPVGSFWLALRQQTKMRYFS